MSTLYPPPIRKTSRIEYIDAMRGFTMFLVVCCHVLIFVLQDFNSPYRRLIIEFHMPLFFFISGFFFYKKNRRWTHGMVAEFLRKKGYVLILFPLLCMILYVSFIHISLRSALIDVFKKGYWFTFVLFQYFCFYILMDVLFQYIRKDGLRDLLFVVVGLVFYSLSVPTFDLLPQNTWTGLLSMPNWYLFIFFIFGTLCKKHFTRFQALMDHRAVITLCLALFVGINFYPPTYYKAILFNLPLSFLGIILVFSFFRRYQACFTQTSRLGRAMQYIGRRTLDIYLLHYFFLQGMQSSHFIGVSALADAPFAEYIVASMLALLIIGASLIVSNLLRLSPIIEEYCFGVKKE